MEHKIYETIILTSVLILLVAEILSTDTVMDR